MHQRMSVNAVSAWSWSLRQNLDFWASRDIGRVGLRAQTITDDPDGVAAVVASGVAVDNVVHSGAFTLGDESDRRADHDRIRASLDLAAAVGARVLYLTTGPSRPRMTVDESTDDFCRAIAPMIDEAAGRSVVLALEHNHASTHDVGCIHTFRDLCRVADRTGIAMVAELQNCWVEYGIADLLAAEVARIALVQVSDYVVGTPTRAARVCPGDGDLPLEPLLGAVAAAGYTGAYDIEVLGPAIDDMGYAAAIDRSIAWLDPVLDRLHPDDRADEIRA